MHKQAPKRLNIFFLTNWYPNNENPVEGIFVQEIVKAVSYAHSVIVIHNTGADPRLDRPWKLELQEDSALTRGIKTYRFRYRPSPIPRTTLLLSTWFFLQAFRLMIRNEGRPDILHAHVYQAGFLAAVVGWILRIPVIVSEHSSAFVRGLLSRSGKLMARVAFQLADVVIPVSTALKNAIIQTGLRGNFQIVPNVVDDEVFNYVEKDGNGDFHHLLYVGLLDLSDNKGLSVLFQALEKVLEDDRKWHLDIIGDGPGRGKYQKMVRESPLAELVTFHGMKTKPEVASAMHNADLFILPSIKETFSVVTAEALATGTPVLATKCGGPEDFIDQNNGVLVEADDPQALSEGLMEILSALDSFDHQKIARDAYLKFSLKVIGEEYTRIYNSVLLR